MNDEHVIRVLDLLKVWFPSTRNISDNDRKKAAILTGTLEETAFRKIIERAWEGDVGAIRYLEEKGFIHLPDATVTQ